MIFIGLDMSLTGTGVCVLRDGGMKCFTVATKPDQFKTRFDRIDSIVSRCLAHVGVGAHLVAIEDAFVHPKHISQATNLIALAYKIREAMCRAGIDYVGVAASQLKKYILGKGKGDKALVIREVWRKLDVAADDDNQADACVLAHIARAVYSSRNDVFEETTKLTSYQTEVVAAIVKGRTC